jgi:hypothetical protein
MQALLAKHRLVWSQENFLFSTFAGVLYFIGGVLCTFGSRYYLLNGGFHTVSSPDTILDMLPALHMENFLVWGVPLMLACMGIVFVLYPEKIPYALKALGLLFGIRAVFVLLTPLGIRPDQVVTTPVGVFQNLAYGSNDFFFSGHTSVPFLFAMIFWQERWIRNLFLGFSLMFGFSVLLAHTHYSIDVFAVPLIVPTIDWAARYLFYKESEQLSAMTPRVAAVKGLLA